MEGHAAVTKICMEGKRTLVKKNIQVCVKGSVNFSYYLSSSIT